MICEIDYCLALWAYFTSASQIDDMERAIENSVRNEIVFIISKRITVKMVRNTIAKPWITIRRYLTDSQRIPNTSFRAQPRNLFKQIRVLLLCITFVSIALRDLHIYQFLRTLSRP